MPSFKKQVMSDYRNLLSYTRLRVDKPISGLLLMQSVLGHAQNKHCKFRKIYPNATLDDIVIALEKNPEDIRNKRQDIINSIFEFAAHLMIFPQKPKEYINLSGNPILSLSLKDLSISDPAAILKGMYLASRMDCFGWREKAMKKYGVNIGGGECVAVDLDKLKEADLTINKLANKSWSEEQIKGFKDSGVIIDKEVNAVTNKIVSAYVRHKAGKGTSDDMAIVLAGRLYGADASMGVFLCDAIDTWDKYASMIMPNGQDEHLGDIIKENEDLIKSKYPGFSLPSEDDLVKFIYTISLQGDKDAVSNSQRYLLQVDRNGQSALESHLKYVKGEDYKPMKLGHILGEVTNEGLYSLFERRLKNNY